MDSPANHIGLTDFGPHLGWLIHVEHSEHGASALILSNEHLQKTGGGLGRDVLLLAVGANDNPGKPGMPGWLLLRTNKSVEIDPHRVEGLIAQVRDQPTPHGPAATIDAYSQTHRSFVGIQCDVLGTYYKREATEDDPREIAFGSDVDFLPGGLLFNVHKPFGDSLEGLINLSRVWHAPPQDLVTVGRVRYTDTRQMAKEDGECFAQVDLRTVLGGRVALFGKTRTGKSNAVKLFAKAIMERNRMNGVTRIGQLIFDVNGEYSRPNPQDPGRTLAALGSETEVAVFSQHREAIHWAGPPMPNLYIDLALGHILGMATEGEAPSNEAWKGLTTLDLGARVSPNDSDSEADLILAKRLAWRILLRALKFPHGVDDTSKDELKKVLWPQHDRDERPEMEFNSQTLCGRIWASFEAERKTVPNGISHAMAKIFANDPVCDPGLLGILQMINGISFLTDSVIQGRSLLSQARSFHSENGKGTLFSTIKKKLDRGYLTILDLSDLSPRQVHQVGEHIAWHIRADALRRFTSGDGKNLQHLILYLEEAHNLIGRSLAGSSGRTTPWALVAKDGAKLGLGMVYSTQEVTDIEPAIRANTETVLAFHLNSGQEIRELTQRHELSRFSEAIARNQRPGHAKLAQRGLSFALPIVCHEYAKPGEGAGVLDAWEERLKVRRMEAEEAKSAKAEMAAHAKEEATAQSKRDESQSDAPAIASDNLPPSHGKASSISTGKWARSVQRN